MVLPSAEMPPFCVVGTSMASSPSGLPLSSVYRRPRRTSLVPLMTLPPSLVMSVFMMETCCHSPIVSVLPPGLAAAPAAGAGGGAARARGAGAAEGDDAAAGEAAVPGDTAGAVVGLGAAGGVVAAGAGAAGAGAHAA